MPRDFRQTAWRALRLCCPVCGDKSLFESWFRVAKACRHCGFKPQQFDSGYVMGALTINMVIAELVALGAIVTMILVMWPDPPWNVVTGVGIALAVAMPFVFYPLSISAFIALNHFLRLQDSEPPPR